MLLQIQADESLTSYVRRNLFLNWRGGGMEVFKQLANRSEFRSSEVKMISSAIGWQGCYGFNRLIHNHTLKAVEFIFKSDQDYSYSQKQYLQDDISFCDWKSSFCPDCVKEDFVTLGFSYWRRSSSSLITVCHKHNTVLMKRCPFCDSAFSQTRHVDVMWRGCGGRFLDEAISVPNDDMLALRRAVMVHDICSSPNHISYVGAIKTLRDKAASLIPYFSGQSIEKIKSLYYKMHGIQDSLSINQKINNAARHDESKLYVLEAITQVYDKYNNFLEDLKTHEPDHRSINSLWGTYQAGGTETADFVEEDFTSRLNNWFCPYPCQWSKFDSSVDGREMKKNILYHCCNLTLQNNFVVSAAKKSD
ncbi:TniQ family protein [Pseudomonas laurylsulfatiphila]|uniref:TniQ family protein n=1 Tax=Pseudomonas laurylsulfatiphila TaxID=2011015 RepID=UPI00215FA5EC|nr:TniQ family protein [Pseudomonas laurylsulfatiphila]UVM05102.1 TniQ family protein [Pseudomonas laurylsulfatiphila]